jgi:hypothetical protein
MTDEICPGCGATLDTPTERHLQMCTKCSERLGVTVMPKPRRPPIQCRACNGTAFIRAVPREIAPMLGNEYHQEVAPMAVTYGATDHGATDHGFRRHQADPQKGYGMLEMYVCKGCALVEWYCADPERIPIGPGYMTEEIDLTTSSPYR